MIVVPPDRLDAEVLNALVESFILQEGTDYGREETSLPSKVAQVRRQLDKGEVLITFDEESQDCHLMTKLEYRRRLEASEAS